MKNLTLVFLVLLLASCSEVDVAPESLTVVKDNVSKEESKPFSNPAIIYGSDFGNFFQTLYIQGKYNEMIKFTSKISIDEFGENAILDYYKNEMAFGFNLGTPKSSNTINSIGQEVPSDYKDAIHVLYYLSDIEATKVATNIAIVIESDSCKVLLPKEIGNFPLIKKTKN